MAEQEAWASAENVENHLGVARDAVSRWIESRSLPAHKVRRLGRFKLSQAGLRIETDGASTAPEEGSIK